MGRNPIGYARRVDRWAGESSRMVNRVGGEIFAKTAKTPPLQSDVCGDGIAIRIAPKGRPLVSPCAYHAHPACLPSMGPYGLYNDAARRVATVFE